MRLLLTDYQSGFRSKHFCETALPNSIDKCLKNLLFIELSKPCDPVYHDVLTLMYRRFSFGICEKTFKVFHSYLHEISQCVKLKATIAKEKICHHQSLLGFYIGTSVSLLFSNYYLTCLKHSTFGSYADDTSQAVSDNVLDVIERNLKDDLLNSMEE